MQPGDVRGSPQPAGEASTTPEAARTLTYELGRLCGKGTFGDVYEGRCHQSGARVAVKLVNKVFLRDKQAQTRLLREIQIQRGLTHPNVLALLDFYEDSGFVYLVTELCEGGELLGLVKQKGRLSEERACALFRQMVYAVEYLHSQSILHRDIKLANILLTAGEDSVLKICDFGLAAALESSDSERVTMCGTPNYLSPEIALNQPYSFASDLWSLGVALYTMVVGTPPFQGRQVSETLQRVKAGQFTLPGHVSHAARDLISGLLRLNPKQRLPLQAVLHHDFLLSHINTAAGDLDSDGTGTPLGDLTSAAADMATRDLSPSATRSSSAGKQPAHIPAERTGDRDQHVDSCSKGLCSPTESCMYCDWSLGHSDKENVPELQPSAQSPDVPPETSCPTAQRDCPCPEPNPVPSWTRRSCTSVRHSSLSPATLSEADLESPCLAQGRISEYTPDSPTSCQPSQLPAPATRGSVDVGALASLASSQELGRCASLLCRSSIVALPVTHHDEHASTLGCPGTLSEDCMDICHRQRPHSGSSVSNPDWKQRCIASTTRLLPRFHSTTYGHLAILEDGSVQVRHSTHGVSVTVLPCGSRVRIERDSRPDKEFCLSEMPPGVEPFYGLAVEFISLVASATPRVVLDCPDVRAVLSEAGDVNLLYKQIVLPQVTRLRVSPDRVGVQLTYVNGQRVDLPVTDLHARTATVLRALPDSLSATDLLKAVALAISLGEKCQRAERRALQLSGGNGKLTYPVLTRSQTKRAVDTEPFRRRTLPPEFPAAVTCNP